MQLSAAEFKTKCLSLMDMVQETQEEVIITKHGKPVAKLVTIKDNTAARLFGYLKGRIQENEDIVPSLGLRWDADSK
ncbi:type II toxin-antitoxin system Phd/YefM family antitoxin [Leptospira sp. WS58.C1]|uniref:type II toxin-antitoxin system Phd/YefM family antitoxin n=1 Tax=Leptospira TaxID=171 RepID=UPI00055FA5B2|nr:MULTISPECIES: type II toxin-antitoxin system prevent-host-death family antitoxin [unclassified Leptospira]MCR1793169.1 type II toxin-antitoxin system prevent-host-death family antitoxin [Leptospira sp. id769339]